MGLIPDPFRSRLELVQVGLLDNVSAVATQLDGACRGRWTITSHDTLAEFLARPNWEIPDGIPLVRLDLTDDDVYATSVAGGPGWCAGLPARRVEPLWGPARRYAGEAWTDTPRWYAATDVYTELAPSAGVVIERLPAARPADS